MVIIGNFAQKVRNEGIFEVIHVIHGVIPHKNGDLKWLKHVNNEVDKILCRFIVIFGQNQRI